MLSQSTTQRHEVNELGRFSKIFCPRCVIMDHWCAVCDRAGRRIPMRSNTFFCAARFRWHTVWNTSEESGLSQHQRHGRLQQDTIAVFQHYVATYFSRWHIDSSDRTSHTSATLAYVHVTGLAHGWVMVVKINVCKLSLRMKRTRIYVLTMRRNFHVPKPKTGRLVPWSIGLNVRDAVSRAWYYF